MVRRTLKILISVLAALFFLWLAFRGVNVQELWEQAKDIRTGWILPFIFALLASHYMRAERWLLLLSDMERRPPRSTLFAGVMLGYMMNYVFPRLGEVSRPVYAGRQLGMSSSNLLGTIVLERILDVLCLIGFLLYISIYIVSDRQTFSRIFGTEHWTTNVYLFLPAVILVLILLIWAGYRILRYLEEKKQLRNPLLVKLAEFAGLFWKGLLTIRDVKNWPLFIIYTVGIWAGYAFMAYLPFRMLDLHVLFNLGILEAMVVTVVSAAGIALPTPGGLGSYHLFVQQSLWLLYSVPLVSALTYATIVHAVTMIIVFVVGAGALWFDKYYTLKNKVVR